MSFASMHNDYLDPDKYIQSEEESAISQMVNALENALRNHPNHGRNQDCWLYSFGWKDADLDPEGCTGIGNVISANETCVTLEIGGHKTLCDPVDSGGWDLSVDDEESYTEQVHAIVCDQKVGGGEWDGGDWSFWWKGIITVNWPEGEINDKWLKTITDEIIEKASQALTPFCKDMARLEIEMDKVYKEIEMKYMNSGD